MQRTQHAHNPPLHSREGLFDLGCLIEEALEEGSPKNQEPPASRGLGHRGGLLPSRLKRDATKRLTKIVL